MQPFKLTVLTELIQPATAGISGKLKSVLRPVKHFLQGRQLPVQKQYGGHYAVTRSLIEGLQKTGIDFKYNPANEKEIAGNVIVLAGVDTLRRAIRLKKRKKINQLFAGPNICVSPAEENGLLADPAIDRCIVPSDWVAAFYLQENNDLQGRLSIWHAGVDTGFWQPAAKRKGPEVIVYWKTETVEFCTAVEAILRENGYTTKRIQYGGYTIEEYKDALDGSAFAVFISRTESQGIALAEAWSMNVPTYVWDPGTFFYNNREFAGASSCPYLTSDTGRRWKELNELEALIKATAGGDISFGPRRHILPLFSDEHCAGELVQKFKEGRV